MHPRYYQVEAKDAVLDYLINKQGSPLVVLPTGTGKSLVLSMLCQEITERWSETRIFVATHVKELVSQDYLEFMELSPFANAGLYSAGLNRRETNNQILFVGIQSVYNKANELGHCDLLIIDEAHTLPKEGEGRWLTFINELKKINPNLRVVGLTATDYRMDSGLLTSGDGALFTEVCYEYGLLQALKDGFLCPIIPKSMATKYDISNVGMVGGEYNQKQLDDAFNIDAKTRAAIDEIETYGADRKSWLIFAAGNKHAESIHAELQRRGYDGACITKDTDRTTRDRAVADIKTGAIRYLVNNKVFTTGFNAKNIDLIADLGPTKSAGLHVQKLGRGTRTIGANIDESIANGKADCLLLDFARNVDYHGPLDKIKGRDKDKGDGDAPVKVCPGVMPDGSGCHELLFAGIRKCFRCGHEFESEGPDIRTHGGDNAVLSTQIEPEWHDVVLTTFTRHLKKGKEYATLQATYVTYAGRFMEWVCFEHPKGGFAHNNAIKWYRQHENGFDMPSSAASAAELEWRKPSRVLVKPDGKFFRIVGKEFSEQGGEVLDFEIPF